MIANEVELKAVRSAWNSVRISQAMVQSNLAMAFSFGGFQTPEFRNLCYNLVLIFAYSVLQEALEKMLEERSSKPKRGTLEAFMQASRQVLPWAAYDIVDDGRKRRNAVAHEQEQLEAAQCLKYIDAIENELVAWRILPGKVAGSYRIEITTLD